MSPEHLERLARIRSTPGFREAQKRWASSPGNAARLADWARSPAGREAMRQAGLDVGSRALVSGRLAASPESRVRSRSPESLARLARWRRSPENLAQLSRILRSPEFREAQRRWARSPENLERLAELARSPEGRARSVERMRRYWSVPRAGSLRESLAPLDEELCLYCDPPRTIPAEKFERHWERYHEPRIGRGAS